MSESESVARRFRVVSPSAGQVAAMTDLRAMAVTLAEAYELLCVPSRETSLALTALEESIMWAVKSVSLNGVAE